MSGTHFAGEAYLEYYLERDLLTLTDYRAMNDNAKKRYNQKATELLNGLIFARGVNCKYDNIIISKMEDQYRHGNREVFRDEMHEYANLYRAGYQPKAKRKDLKKNDDQNGGEKNNSNDNDKEKPEDGTAGAHFDANSSAVAGLFAQFSEDDPN